MKSKIENKRKFIQIIIVLVLIFAGTAVLFGLKNSGQKHEENKPADPVQSGSDSSDNQARESKPVESLPKAFVMQARKNAHTVYIEGQGTVVPLHEIELISRVSGKIVYISEKFVDGGFFEKDEILIKIDPVDYELAVTSAQAKVKSSESEYYLAKEESVAAKQEWNLAYGTNSKKRPPPLVIKQPQLEAALAALKANEADLEKAKLQLKRCVMKAPFHGIVSGKNADLEQYVSTGHNLGSVFSIQAVEISIPLADEELHWFDVPGFTSEHKEADVLISADIAGIHKTWQGKVVRAHGKIDEQTRMIKVVVRVENPYKESPPLAVGLFVSAKIVGRTLSDTVAVPRAALRNNNTVWIVDNNNRLIFRKIQLAKIFNEQAVIQSGISDGEHVIVSRMKVVSDGMKVRKIMNGE
jgi:RND family efflux transporter MFP subunit